jgi:hypothetical protein
MSNGAQERKKAHTGMLRIDKYHFTLHHSNQLHQTKTTSTNIRAKQASTSSPA